MVSSDPEYIAPLLASERVFINQMMHATNAEDRNGAIMELADYYLYYWLNPQKASALMLLIPPDEGYAVRTQIKEAESPGHSPWIP